VGTAAVRPCASNTGAVEAGRSAPYIPLDTSAPDPPERPRRMLAATHGAHTPIPYWTQPEHTWPLPGRALPFTWRPPTVVFRVPPTTRERGEISRGQVSSPAHDLAGKVRAVPFPGDIRACPALRNAWTERSRVQAVSDSDASAALSRLIAWAPGIAGQDLRATPRVRIVLEPDQLRRVSRSQALPGSDRALPRAHRSSARLICTSRRCRGGGRPARASDDVCTR